MKDKSRAAKNAILSRSLKNFYAKKIIAIAEHSHYSAMLRADYPYVSEIFASLSASDIEALGQLRELLAYLGCDVTFDVRMRSGVRGSGNVNGIIKAELDNLKQERGEIERICSLAEDPRTRDMAEQILPGMSENIRVFERMMLS